MYNTKCPRCTNNMVVKTIGNTLIKTCYKCGAEKRTRLEYDD